MTTTPEPTNPARAALTNAVNRAIANGAPVYVNQPADAPKSFKVGVKTPGDRSWSYNMLRFATRTAAETYGADLAWRWTAVTDWEVHESDDEPNR